MVEAVRIVADDPREGGRGIGVGERTGVEAQPGEDCARVVCCTDQDGGVGSEVKK